MIFTFLLKLINQVLSLDFINKVFHGVRPSLVVDESSVDGALSQHLQTEFALSRTAGTTVEMSNKLEDQFVSRYLSSIFLGLLIMLAVEQSTQSSLVYKHGQTWRWEARMRYN